MPKPNPHLFIASGRANRIGYRKVSAMDRRSPRGATFHETWEQAHAALVARLQDELEKAGRDAKRAIARGLAAHKALEKAKAMKAEDLKS